MLKLEPPYKDDAGNRLPVLLDIAPDGTRVYEPAVDPQKSLGERLRRIFAERGHDFFERNNGQLASLSAVSDDQTIPTDDEPASEPSVGPMTPEELLKMRAELLPQLFTALGEMTLAKDLLNMLLSSAPPSATALLTGVPAAAPSSGTLSATTVTKPPPIISVQAFDAQLTIGGKDEALRRAAGVFKAAAESMERARIRGERYWIDALKIRRANWGLIPAPLPFGAPTGKGADKTSKDFLISYGLEESSPIFRRRAVGRMPTYEQPSEPLVFPHRQNTRLFISVGNVSPAGRQILSQNTMTVVDDSSVDAALRSAQREIVEHEIFSCLVKEAGSLPTASARVSERLIVIDAAKGVELKFELLDADTIHNTPPGVSNAKCDLIYHMLQALLLRMHGHAKRVRLSGAGLFQPPGAPDAPPAPLLLRPVIDLLQYEVFCARVEAEISAARDALNAVGILATLRFVPVGGTGQALMELLDASEERVIGGEAVLRIDNRHTVRLTVRSPSSLTAHLAQATLPISSIPQLRQLLGDEIEGCLLRRFCEMGRELCEHAGGTWFVDHSQCVGRWDGCVLNFRTSVRNSTIHCVAFRLSTAGWNLLTYSLEPNVPLLTWVQQTIHEALSTSIADMYHSKRLQP
ncbi:subunit 17 of mediator complex-domain-containing protein [Mycena pura]|uniref:Mediator of RNA polymerase II transcription subunit 17 n=1 Tax=Mycena pura TaxID=153505 RepID=A0AAD6YSW7_9AGAR|nr:subunit 17 of mediator complex-domain-containing protein [Mycena pura]